MPRTRSPYPPEFRLEAVRRLRAGVRTPKQLAVELGCSEQTLRPSPRAVASIEKELLRRKRFTTREQARLRIF
jgi:transposase-like protein